MKVVYSWNVIDDKDFYKVVDKSVIVSKESGIPHDIRYLFELEDNKEIKLIYKEMEFTAKLTTNINNGVLRSRIRFNSLLNVIGNRIAIGDFMCFKRIDKDVFKVEILNRHNDDIEGIQNIEVIKQEGMYKIAYYTSKYENDESVKKEAIKYHGLNCEVCNFNFEEKYGSLGKDFIELHNLKPITKLDGNDDIDIKTDLICICSNCHRMIHRNKNKVLMPEDLKKIINKRGGERMIYLDNAATTYPKPSEVYDVLDNANRNLAFNAGRGHYPKADEAFSLIESTRRFLCNKAASKNLVFTPSATHALNQIISGIEYLKDDVVYYSPYDHNAIVRTLHAYSKKIGFQLKKIPLKKDNSIDLEKLNFDILLDKPKALFCTHVSNVTGYILPIEKIGKITRENGVLFIVDGAQAFGLLPVDVTAMNIDYYVFAGHKTLYGPFGIAGYFSNTNKLKMSFFGGTGTDSLNIEMPKDEIVKFEPSSPNIVAIAGLQTAAKWIFEKDLYNHEKGLFDYAYEKLRLLDDVVIYNDPNLPNTGIISFNLKGYKSEDVSDILAKDFDVCTRGGYHCCPFIHDVLDTKKYLGTVRISFSYFTTKNDIDYLIEALEEILYES